MLGDSKAEEDFLNLVEALVRVHPVSPAGGLNNPVPEVPSAEVFSHVLQPDDPIAMTADLAEDLTDLSLLRNPRAIRIMIEALSSHRRRILDSSEFLLQNMFAFDLRRQQGVPWRDPGVLYNLKLYYAMVHWWDGVHDRLRWDQEKHKFNLSN
jgi:hypothetical protein